MSNEEQLKLILKTISPVFIGTGEIISRAEIALKNHVLYVANIEKMANKIDLDKLNKLIRKAVTEKKGKHEELERIVKEGYEYRVVTGKNVEDISLELKEHIKVKNNLYIPGSSIKGSILSAIINTSLIELAEFSQAFQEFVEDIANKKFKDKNKINSALVGIALQWLKNKDQLIRKYREISKDEIKELGKRRFDRWIQVTDTNLVKIEKYGVILPVERKGGKGAPLPILQEMIRRNKELEFEMNLLNSNQEVKLKQLLEIVDKYYTKIFEKELKWCQDRKIRLVNNKLQKEENEYLLRIGLGTGNTAISLIPTMQELDPKNRLLATYGKNWRLTRVGGAAARSKWFAEYPTKDGKRKYSPLGWVKVSIKE
ncbi:MAG: type III-A CRISPR-associated RAMP protein Csm5 [Candidatus Heimdallarchaeum endolithica]|uniref:CRISPR system Cms protein Csm5 n=1 Tax=Candidatus Heimdallarchaeum endolithica TaxID=2876572 RepID=A0A9Y1FQ50_9ARCH|nr:MAG: type III-A CRISPR-associated RAMP protein Csm5 [Candidatus Heimdallarchaeum endolithica]